MVWPCLKVFSFSKDNSIGHVNGKEEEVDKIRSGITMLKSAQRCILPAQLGQLKTEMMERDCCKVIANAPATLQGCVTD